MSAAVCRDVLFCGCRKMKELQFQNGLYITKERSISLLARLMPSFHFWVRLVGVVLRSGSLARKGKYDEAAWQASSREIYDFVEDVGGRIRISGMENLENLDGPCVIVANHMSFLETVLLPGMILRSHEMTFVIKESLLDYPVFKDVIQVCSPIAVTRTNPRQDLKKVLTEGTKRLKEGVSVAVFPQSTRSHIFDPGQMSSIGVKLAKKADVPIIPLALKTDALKNGTIIKDIGKLDTSIPVHFAFGEPIRVEGKGAEEQRRITDYIGESIDGWTREQEVADR